MADVKQRMIDIVNSVPDNYFDGLKPTEMVFKLMMEYIKRLREHFLKYIKVKFIIFLIHTYFKFFLNKFQIPFPIFSNFMKIFLFSLTFPIFSYITSLLSRKAI